MKLINLAPSDLVLSDELSRSGSAKQFEERLKASIEEIGLVEPIKVAPLPTGKYVVVDGTMRLRAIGALKEIDPDAFPTIPAYVMDYERRYELRFQTDVYQDLLPSQLADLVEHLHKTEHIRKADIARYIGVSPATLRNYTGLWRLLQRGELFARVVELMDVGVIPSSNPYAWLRLTAPGLRYVIEHDFSKGKDPESWIDQCVLDVRRGKFIHFPIKYIEATTDALPPEYYREGEDLRTVKRDLGLRRGAQAKQETLDMSESEPTATPATTEQSPNEARDLPCKGDLEPHPYTADPKRYMDEHAQSVVRSEKMQVGRDYRKIEEARTSLRDPGARHGEHPTRQTSDNSNARSETPGARDIIKYLSRVVRLSSDPVLKTAARSLQDYLE